MSLNLFQPELLHDSRDDRDHPFGIRAPGGLRVAVAVCAVTPLHVRLDDVAGAVSHAARDTVDGLGVGQLKHAEADEPFPRAFPTGLGFVETLLVTLVAPADVAGAEVGGRPALVRASHAKTFGPCESVDLPDAQLYLALAERRAQGREPHILRHPVYIIEIGRHPIVPRDVARELALRLLVLLLRGGLDAERERQQQAEQRARKSIHVSPLARRGGRSPQPRRARRRRAVSSLRRERGCSCRPAPW